MALSRIRSFDHVPIALISFSRTATSLKIQHTVPIAVHRRQQCVNTLYIRSVRRYPDPPRLDLPSNMRDIFGNVTGRFALDPARCIALYSENGAAMVTDDSINFPTIHDDSRVDLYDHLNVISLRGTMRTNVPEPYCSRGTDVWTLNSTYLHMPGGQCTRHSVYVAEDMQKSHYCNLRLTSCSVINVTSSFLQTTNQLMRTIGANYSTDASRSSKNVANNSTATATATTPITATMAMSMSRRDRFRLMLRDYGGTMIAFHITISLISLGACYMVVVSGVDMMSLVQKITGGNEQLDVVMKTSSDFIIAYTVHKILAPFRMSITLAVTPLLVRRLRKIGLLKIPKIQSPSSPRPPQPPSPPVSSSSS